MYRKSLISLVAFALYLALAFCACGCMLLIPQVNQYVGVGVGGGVCIVCALLTVIANVREWSRVYLPVLICNGLGSGIAASSLFVFLKASPAATDYLIAWALLVGAFVLFCLLTYIPFSRRYPVPCMVLYALAVLAGYITLVCLVLSHPYVLTALFLLPFIGFFVSLARRAEYPARQLEHVAGASCFSIAVVVIIVLLVVSQGEGLDGLDGSGLSSGGIYGDRRRKYNPYDFEL